MNTNALEMLNYPIWILRIAFFGILVIALGFVVTKYVHIRTDVTPVESFIVMHRIFNSPALMYQDSITKRAYPTSVDITKIQDKTTETRLNNEINLKHVAAHITLENEPRDVYLNKRLFTDLNTQFRTAVFGLSVTMINQSYRVRVYDGKEWFNDKLTIEVVQER